MTALLPEDQKFVLVIEELDRPPARTMTPIPVGHFV
jgi:hypothetical protein